MSKKQIKKLMGAYDEDRITANNDLVSVTKAVDMYNAEKVYGPDLTYRNLGYYYHLSGLIKRPTTKIGKQVYYEVDYIIPALLSNSILQYGLGISSGERRKKILAGYSGREKELAYKLSELMNKHSSIYDM